MSEQKQTDKQLNDYLAGKSDISSLYQQLETNEPSHRIDARIFAAAREDHGKSAEIIPLRHRRWTIPASIAAVLIVGISVLWWQNKRIPDQIESIESAAPPRDTTTLPQLDDTSRVYESAEAWLDAILKLHQNGDEARASAEYKKFRQAYPNYPIDSERFKPLQQYDR